MTHDKKRSLFEKYSSAVVYVEVEHQDGTRGIGSAFHVGDGVFVTARHVVEHKRIRSIAANEVTLEAKAERGGGRAVAHGGGEAARWEGPFLHPDSRVDVAALVVHGVDCAVLPLGAHLDDWIGSEFVLTAVVMMGYPPIPHARSPILVAVSGEVNAVVDLYSAPNARFVVSQVARGGFSGGPAISEYGFVLGVVTDSLVEGDKSVESGFCSVLAVEPILDCLEHHKIMPQSIREFWSDSFVYGGNGGPPPGRWESARRRIRRFLAKVMARLRR